MPTNPATRESKPKVKMRFSLNFIQEYPLQEVTNWCKASEKAGIDLIGLADSPVLLRELYVSATYCLMNTSKIKMISCVSNPITRHPSVTASALFSTDEIAPGRFGLGISTGDSAIWGIGGKFATVAQLREYILAVKGMLRGEEVEYQGQRFKPQWSHWTHRDIPICVACSGPKALKMASQVADGMVIAMGYAPENIQYVNHIIKEGCAEVGRDPNKLDIWWTTGIEFANSVEEAMETNIGSSVSWMVMGSMEGKQIPEEYKEPLRKLAEGSHQFSSSYLNPNRGRDTVKRAKELGVYDWLITRASRLWGTPEDIKKRLAELGALGLTNWMFYVGGQRLNRYDLISSLSKVIPAFK